MKKNENNETQTNDYLCNYFNFHIQYNGMMTKHSHKGFYEFIFILSGQIDHLLNGKSTIVDQNTLIFLTQSDCHALKKVTEDSYYACLSIGSGHFKELMKWIAPDTYEDFLQNPVIVEFSPQEAIEISNMTNRLHTASREEYYVILHLLTMTFVKKIAMRFENAEKGVTHHPAVAKFIQYVKNPQNLSLSLDEILAAINYSYPHINRLVKAELGCSAGQYLQNQKMNYAQKLLTFTNKPLSNISEMLGFSGYSHFSLSFKKQTGISPSQYRNKNSQPLV